MFNVIIFLFVLGGGVTKPYCNEVINLQESSSLTQIQCLPESNNNNNNRTVSDKVIQSHLFNYGSQSDIILFERENNENIIANQIETLPHYSHKNVQKKNNLFMPLELNMSSEINIENNNVNTAHSLITIEDVEDLNTTQAIMSLAMKITSQHDINFKYTDGFEDEKINNVNIVSTSDDIQTNLISPLIHQNGDQSIDPLKQEEEYQISNNSLKLLESLVNFEHSKLEGQTSLSEEELKLSNIESNEKKHSRKSKKTNLKEEKSGKSKEKKHKISSAEKWTSKDKKQKDYSPENNIKSKKEKKGEERKLKKYNKNAETQNNVNNSVQRNFSSSIEMQNDQNILLGINDCSFNNPSKHVETKISTITNSKSMTDKSISVGIPLETENIKYDLSTNHSRSVDVEKTSISEKECHTTTTNDTLLKSSSIVSTTYIEKNIDNLKNISSSHSCSVIKPSDYKKIYEMDRKSLFNPDIVITSKLVKDSTNDMCIKNNPIKEKILDKMCITKKNKSVNKKKLSHHNCLKIRITNGKINKAYNTKMVPDSTTNGFNQKRSSCSTTSVNKFKRLKVHVSDDEDKTNIDLNKNESSTTDILVKKESNTTKFLKNKEINNIDMLKNQEFNEKEILKNEQFNKDDLKNNLISDRIKQLCVKYNIKPVYIVIDRNKTY